MKGYSSFPDWNELSETKENEHEERGNDWFDDSHLDIDEYMAKWVCTDAKYALWYVFSLELFGLAPDVDAKPEDVSISNWVNFKKAWKNPLEHVYEIDLTGAEKVLDDPDHGALFIKRK